MSPSQLLLVEDNASNRKLIGSVLRKAGYKIVEADNADKAIELCLTEKYDLILMDIQLPGTDGLSATRILRSSPRTEDVPIIAVTAHAMRGDEKRILNSGCDGYISKPIAYKKLVNEVKRLLNKKDKKACA